MVEKPKMKREDKEHSAKKRKKQVREEQKERSYYYDDAHGYEVYDPNEQGEDDDNKTAP